MKILITMQHPAHVHFFKNAIKDLEAKGHLVKILAVDREMTSYLLDSYGFDYQIYEELHSGMVKKGLGQVRRNFKLHKISKEFNPDIITAAGEIAVTQMGKLLDVGSIVWPDTEPDKILHTLSFPFASAIVAPDCFRSSVPSDNYIYYPGYHELAYLHPNHFQPDPSVLDKLGLTAEDSIILTRFSSWDASHDIGQRTFENMKERVKLVEELEKYGRVFVTSEIKLPQELEDKELNIRPEDIHNFLSYTDIYIGEGATLASEAGVLGVPWIWIAGKEWRGYLDDQESKYGLGYSIGRPEKALKKSKKLLQNTEKIKKEWKKKRKRLLAEKIDVTSFMVWFFENWPKSLKDCKKDEIPDFTTEV